MIASSHTRPMASIIPIKVRTLMEIPVMYMIKKVEIIEMGMATTGINVDLQSRRKK